MRNELRMTNATDVVQYGKAGGALAVLAGRLLQRYSQRIIALAADVLLAMRDLQNVKTGQMSVAASQTTGVYLMPPLIGARCACTAALSPARCQQ